MELILQYTISISGVDKGKWHNSFIITFILFTFTPHGKHVFISHRIEPQYLDKMDINVQFAQQTCQ